MLLLAPSFAEAVCPSSVNIIDNLTCSSVISSNLGSGAGLLGGTCSSSSCYQCGTPYSPLAQTGPEHVYSFTCQQSGSVTMDVSGMDCDLDIYILDDSCDPYSGCDQGSTEAFVIDDSVSFTCTANTTYYIVIEGYGYTYSGTSACTGGDGDYQLSFDVSSSTGCTEDCVDGIDNDLDGDVDCDDSDCFGEPACQCDDDGDGYDSLLCGGSDCDDTDPGINPGAPEVCNGIDDDCDGVIDDGFDLDGDGVTTCGGDCDDTDPLVNSAEIEVCNGVDDDCDLLIDEGFDLDGDGFTSCGGDCNDSDGTINPGVSEVCNGVDDDCDGTIDNGFDQDNDTWTTCAGDCNDFNVNINRPARDLQRDR